MCTRTSPNGTTFGTGDHRDDADALIAHGRAMVSRLAPAAPYRTLSSSLPSAHFDRRPTAARPSPAHRAPPAPAALTQHRVPAALLASRATERTTSLQHSLSSTQAWLQGFAPGHFVRSLPERSYGVGSQMMTLLAHVAGMVRYSVTTWIWRGEADLELPRVKPCALARCRS